MNTIRTSTGLHIGGAHIGKPPIMSHDAEAVQRALLDWRKRHASSIIGTSRDLHRVRVGRRSAWWRAVRVMRALWQWLRSPRAL
jgi:hypothetical protein